MGSRAAQQGRGLSVRQLTLIFFGAVGLCALFFALGFLLGVNRRSAASLPSVEQVQPPGEIPPAVDSSLQNAGAGSQAPNAHQATVIEQNLKETSLSKGMGEAESSSHVGQSAAKATKESSAARTAPLASARSARSLGQTGPVGRVARGVMVQVAALRTGRDAQSLLHTLKLQHYAAVMLTPAESHDGLYRVQVGPFATRVEAVRALRRLSSQGFRPFIRQ